MRRPACRHPSIIQGECGSHDPAATPRERRRPHVGMPLSSSPAQALSVPPRRCSSATPSTWSCSGDPDEMIAVRSRDLRTPDDYREIARALEAGGRPDEALDWAVAGSRPTLTGRGRPPRCASSQPGCCAIGVIGVIGVIDPERSSCSGRPRRGVRPLQPRRWWRSSLTKARSTPHGRAPPTTAVTTGCGGPSPGPATERRHRAERARHR
jgi:hypothetical protein